MDLDDITLAQSTHKQSMLSCLIPGKLDTFNFLSVPILCFLISMLLICPKYPLLCHSFFASTDLAPRGQNPGVPGAFAELRHP